MAGRSLCSGGGGANWLAVSQGVRSLAVWELYSWCMVYKIVLGVCPKHVSPQASALFLYLSSDCEVLEVFGKSVFRVSHSEHLGFCVQWSKSLEPFVNLHLPAVWASLSRV